MFSLQLDDDNFRHEDNDEDPQVAAVRMMPLEAQIQEICTALIRHHLHKRGRRPETIVAFDRSFPRTCTSIQNKNVIFSLLGVRDGESETSERSILEHMLKSIEKATMTVCSHVVHRCEDESLKNSVLEAFATSKAAIDDREIAKQLSLDFSFNRTFLEMIVDNALSQASIGAGGTFSKKTFEINHVMNALEVNGVQIGTTSHSEVERLDQLKIGAAVGKGAGGSVVRATHTPTGKEYAVKVIQLSDGNISQAQSELSVVWDDEAKKQSPFLIRCFGVFYADMMLYIVMEMMSGSLKDLIVPKGLPEAQCRALAWQALQGLKFMHSTCKQLHRDIKPHNILFRKGDGSVKISDFGISSTRLETVNFNKKSTYCGTVRYMSPLVIETSDYGYEADLWSFGVTLLELALGDLPYNGDNAFAVAQLRKAPPRLPPNGKFSPEFESFISDLCDPTGSPPTAAEMLMHPWLAKMTERESRSIVQSL